MRDKPVNIEVAGSGRTSDEDGAPIAKQLPTPKYAPPQMISAWHMHKGMRTDRGLGPWEGAWPKTEPAS
jgi:hypothetical protein